MLKKLSVLSLSFLLFPAIACAESSAINTPIGDISGQVGIDFRVDEAKDDSNDGDIGIGFLEIGFLSNEYKGARLGFGFIGALELWSEKSYEFAFDDGGNFEDNVMLRDLYLQYSITSANSELLIGRKQFEGTPVTDGDVHQGVQLTFGEIGNSTIYVSAVNRWVDNASTAYDMDGINDTWIDGDDVVQGASDTTYSFMAQLNPIPDVLVVTPFINHQNKVVTSYGSSVDVSFAINEQLEAGFDGVAVGYDEDTDSVSDEDAYSYLAHTSLTAEKWQIGLGYYIMSDDQRVGLTALGNDTFDPMEEGPHSAIPDDKTIFVEASYAFGPMTLSAVFGDTEVDLTNEGATELDIYLEYAISDTINAELMFVDVNDDDSSQDYQVYAGTINYSY